MSMRLGFKLVPLAVGALALIGLSVSVFASRSASDAERSAIPVGVTKLASDAGVQIAEASIPAPDGMKGWAAFKGQQPLAFYSTNDGKYVIAGTLFDAKGNDLTRAPLLKAVGPMLSDGLWGRLANSHWIGEGNPDAKRILYVVTDPNCPYCSRLWRDTQPWVRAGTVQVRNIVVGILTPTSYGKAAALLAASNPEQAFHDHQAAQFEVNKSNAPGRMKSLNGSGITPLTSVDSKLKQKLAANQQLMADLGVNATPALFWKDDEGAVKSALGEPRDLASILGPK